jgi:hypothetical protein
MSIRRLYKRPRPRKCRYCLRKFFSHYSHARLCAGCGGTQDLKTTGFMKEATN